MNNIILISLLAILGIFSISFVQTSFAEEKIIIVLPTISDPECAKNDTCFSPSTLYMNVGDTFTIESHANAFGQITFGKPETGPEPYLSGHLEKGIHYYYVMFWPWAVGKIVVGIEDAPKQSYEDSKAKLEKIEQEMKQQ